MTFPRVAQPPVAAPERRHRGSAPLHRWSFGVLAAMDGVSGEAQVSRVQAGDAWLNQLPDQQPDCGCPEACEIDHEYA